jgi:ribosomal protein S27AE
MGRAKCPRCGWRATEADIEDREDDQVQWKCEKCNVLFWVDEEDLEEN